MGQISSMVNSWLSPEPNHENRENQRVRQPTPTYPKEERSRGLNNAHVERNSWSVPAERQYGQAHNARIKLYHYTTQHSARGIRRDGSMRDSNPNTLPQHRKYGQGVYFTTYSPYDLEPDQLALNCFTHRQKIITNPKLYWRIHYIVEIDFDNHEVERINANGREVYVHRGSIDLGRYEGRYRIYENPRFPYHAVNN